MRPITQFLLLSGPSGGGSTFVDFANLEIEFVACIDVEVLDLVDVEILDIIDVEILEPEQIDVEVC